MRTSIAMCTYNGARFLPEQLASIRAQTLQPFEMVVCDDGSTDATPALIEQFASEAPFPVRWVRNEHNLGSTKNFEKAVSLCTGELIALCDQDDIWMPEKLEVCTKALRDNPDIAAVFSDAFLIGDEGERLPGTLWDRAQFRRKEQLVFAADQTLFLTRRSLVTGATLIFRSSAISKLVPFPSEWIHDEWLALVLSAISGLQPIPEFLISYRLHASQQIGFRAVTRREALRLQQAERVEHQRRLTRRLTAAADRLEKITGAESTARFARLKAAYMADRAVLLQGSRRSRLLTGLAALPGHFRYGSGLISYVRDLWHA